MAVRAGPAGGRRPTGPAELVPGPRCRRPWRRRCR
jgi:hypothetical protein